MPKIFLKFNEAILKEIELDRPQLTIGRKEDNDLTIDNLAVSGHHARIVQEHGAYFIEDRDSTNGTFLNDKRIQRQQLRNGDQIRIGKHLLVYEGEETPAPAAPPPSKGVDLDKTMILDTQKQRELLQAKQPAGAAPKAAEKVGVLEVISGQTDRNEYTLAGRLTIVGAQDTATVKLTGWFAPKVAALISRRPDGYSISTSEEGKKILLNGVPLQGRGELKDGDLIEVAGVKMSFYLKEQAR